MDSARGLALLLGIVLHATMSFFLVIPARDSSQSVTLAVTFYVIHLFRMSLFFVLAGFFGHLVYHRRGLRGFLKDRFRRVLVPLSAGWVILAPLTIAAVIWGLSRTFPGVRRGAPTVALPRKSLSSWWPRKSAPSASTELNCWSVSPFHGPSPATISTSPFRP